MGTLTKLYAKLGEFLKTHTAPGTIVCHPHGMNSSWSPGRPLAEAVAVTTELTEAIRKLRFSSKSRRVKNAILSSSSGVIEATAEMDCQEAIDLADDGIGKRDPTEGTVASPQETAR